MKKEYFVIAVLISNVLLAQTMQEKEAILVPEIALDIWDIENSEKSLKIDSLSYDEIPKYLDFRGTVVAALKWNDTQGENVLVLSKSGDFAWKEYRATNSSEFQLQDRSEIFTYLFQKPTNESKFEQKWRIYDYTDCFGVDMYAGFKENGLTVTDLDKDGIAEIAIPYVLICRGGMDPGIMKIIMYEDDRKYALRGETAICRTQEILYGGEYKADDATAKNQKVLTFLEKRWQVLKCE